MEHTRLRQPIYNRDRHLIGVRIDRDFALKCDAVTADDIRVKRCLDFAWPVTRPKDWHKNYMPPSLFGWGRGTMLPSVLQHYDDSGKCLELIPQSIDHYDEDEPAVLYDFHHARDHLDDEANRWLWVLFDRWVKCMMAEIAHLKEPG